MAAIAFTGNAGFRLTVPAIAFFTRYTLESSALGVGLLTSAFFMTRAFSSIAAGNLADKVGVRAAYAASASFLGHALVIYAYPFAANLPLVLFARSLQGLLSGAGKRERSRSSEELDIARELSSALESRWPRAPLKVAVRGTHATIFLAPACTVTDELVQELAESLAKKGHEVKSWAVGWSHAGLTLVLRW